MVPPEEEFTAAADPPQPSLVQVEPPQRSPQPSFVQVEPLQPSAVQAAGWSAQRSPQQSTVQAMNYPPPGSNVLPPVRLKSALKTQDSAARKLCHAPVTARAPKDMIGAHTERSTGITYPYNMWGPCNPTRFGRVGEMPPNRGHKHNYQGKHVSRIYLE